MVTDQKFVEFTQIWKGIWAPVHDVRPLIEEQKIVNYRTESTSKHYQYQQAWRRVISSIEMERSEVFATPVIRLRNPQYDKESSRILLTRLLTVKKYPDSTWHSGIKDAVFLVVEKNGACAMSGPSPLSTMPSRPWYSMSGPDAMTRRAPTIQSRDSMTDHPLHDRIFDDQSRLPSEFARPTFNASLWKSMRIL
ncbi:hypothetical protein ARMSODRAFT_981494 [Armillaria solidipes]|uniref:Uncharacterized protein n=1 Tax=Armillaria solidipes TaxID=1076256 RepID=A0A2H3BAC8_9AGAR|nr:hypothetical protein ARMSODRAFT_981494 [Armillaria solidipes]